MTDKPSIDAALQILKPGAAVSSVRGNEISEPRLVFRPVTNEQLWRLCIAYMPAEIHEVVVQRLAALFETEKQATAPSSKGPTGNDADVVEEWRKLPGWDKTKARKQVAAMRGKNVKDVARAHRRKYPKADN